MIATIVPKVDKIAISIMKGLTLELSENEIRAIQLVSTLRATAASLETYDRIVACIRKKGHWQREVGFNIACSMRGG